MSNPKVVKRFPIKSPGKLYYGPWPSVEMLRTLKKLDVDTIWNLAQELDLIIPYEKYFVPNVIHGNIEDFYIPENITHFATQLNQIAGLLRSGKNVFIHCFGGHGRTGMALAAIDLMVSDSEPKVALRKAHGATGGPEERSQVDFVQDLYLYLQGKPIPKRKKKDRWEDFRFNQGNQRGFFKQDLNTGKWVWVEESVPWGDVEDKSVLGPPVKMQPIPYVPQDPGQSLTFMEWWGKHPEFKDYDAAKAFWAKEQKAIRKKLKKEQQPQSEFCPYCGAHLMYPRDSGHIAKHFRNNDPLPPKNKNNWGDDTEEAFQRWRQPKPKK
jgi:hypothetical protein